MQYPQPPGLYFSAQVAHCVFVLCACMCVSVSAPVVPSIFLLVISFGEFVWFFSVFNVCALGFWVLLSHQLLCDVDQAQQMLRPSFNAAMSAPLMYIFFICFCVPARLIRWLTINTYIHTYD